eukprot:m.102168 g.102168  ORF g.102168 m.102168 type:complete len:86 (+) comp51531_c0_seq1:714-971(+)
MLPSLSSPFEESRLKYRRGTVSWADFFVGHFHAIINLVHAVFSRLKRAAWTLASTKPERILQNPSDRRKRALELKLSESTASFQS